MRPANHSAARQGDNGKYLSHTDDTAGSRDRHLGRIAVYAFKTIARAALIATALGIASVATAGAVEPVAAAGKTTVAPASSSERQDRRVRIHNNTGWTMLNFYASNVNTTNWEEDILGEDVLSSGSSIVMNIDDGTGACRFDFKAVFTNGQELIRNDVNVCQIADYYYTR